MLQYTLDPEIKCYSMYTITWARKLRVALHLGHPFLCIQAILLPLSLSDNEGIPSHDARMPSKLLLQESFVG
jgi:hypothetical protein